MMNHTFWRKIRLSIAPALIFIIAGCHGDEKKEETVVAVQAVPAQKTDISQVVNAEGVLFPLAQAKSQYNIAMKHLDSLNAVTKKTAVQSATGQLTSAKGKYMGAEAQLGYSEIRSPIDGVITDRPLYPGEMASTSAPLLTVMDVSSVIAKIHVPQGDAQLLRKGDKAAIEVSGLEKFPATVMLVSPALDPGSTTLGICV